MASWCASRSHTFYWPSKLLRLAAVLHVSVSAVSMVHYLPSSGCDAMNASQIFNFTSSGLIGLFAFFVDMQSP
jgi:hypothetical protein